MSTLSVRLPDDVASRLKSLAHSRNISLNKLMNELSTRILVEEEAKQQFLGKRPAIRIFFSSP